MSCGAVTPSDLPRSSQKVDEDDDDIDLSDEGELSRSSVAKTNARAPKNIRGPARKDDDSGSDFDL